MRFLRLFVLLGGMFLAIGLLIVGTAMAADSIETPKHTVLMQASAPIGEATIEHRRYEPMIVAEVTVEADDRDAASSKGFRPLAGYIFGRNAPSERIAMTAPVATAPADGGAIPTGGGERIAMTAPVTTAPSDAEGTDGRYTVRFMMPSQYTMDALPAPLDPAVELVEVPGRDIVALRFVGERSAERVDAAASAVDAFIAERGLKPIGPYAVAGYDGPDVPTAERRWEVQRPVATR